MRWKGHLRNSAGGGKQITNFGRGKERKSWNLLLAEQERGDARDQQQDHKCIEYKKELLGGKK